ncbi:MAG: single-stranded DNA-binding protein [Candidatus Dormibacteria bacterium]
MAGTLNKVMLIGRLTRDPEMRVTPSGQPVTSFGLATNRWAGGGEGGERKELTDFHDIVAWNIGKRTLAELCAQFLHKGSLVYIEGRLTSRSWEDKNTGQKRYKTEVVAEDVQFLEPRSAGASGEYQPSAVPVGAGVSESVPSGGDVDPDDIPF